MLNVREWQKRNDDARAADKQALDELLRDLDTNQQRIIEAIGKLHEHSLNDLTEFTASRSGGAPE